MPTVQQGDRVQVHYVKRFQDGSVVSSRSRGHAPLELTIGTHHPRLPGLGLALVGLAEGESTMLRVAPEQAFGLSDPSRVRQLNRKCFRADRPLPVGKWVRITGRRSRRLVRIVEVRDDVVVVDINHPRAGQGLELEVELIRIHAQETAPT